MLLNIIESNNPKNTYPYIGVKKNSDYENEYLVLWIAQDDGVCIYVKSPDKFIFLGTKVTTEYMYRRFEGVLTLEND